MLDKRIKSFFVVQNFLYFWGKHQKNGGKRLKFIKKPIKAGSKYRLNGYNSWFRGLNTGLVSQLLSLLVRQYYDF
jgi:hypothetical protein